MMKKLFPPANFAPAGNVTWAQFYPGQPSYIKPRKVKGSRAEGIRYEKKAQDYLDRKVQELGLSSLELLRSPWITFRCGENPRERFCQPDAVLTNIEEHCLTIFEFKLQHTQNAWWQVRQLYAPVLQFLYPGWQVYAVEVVKWMDPHTPFPETFFFAETLFARDGAKFAIHTYNPRINK